MKLLPTERYVLTMFQILLISLTNNCAHIERTCLGPVIFQDPLKKFTGFSIHSVTVKFDTHVLVNKPKLICDPSNVGPKFYGKITIFNLTSIIRTRHKVKKTLKQRGQAKAKWYKR